MTRRYRLHGLLIESALALDAAATQAHPDDAVDVEMHEVSEPPPDADGPVACEIEVPAGTYVGRVGDDGWSLRLAGEYAFRAPAGDRRVLAWAPERNRSSLPALLAGNVLAFWLQLHGHAVFHASAATIDGRTIAIAGHQGAGKTTVAAHLCAAGGELLTDDVLRVDPAGDGFVCHEGGNMLRLRPDVEHLADVVPSTSARRSWDGRLGVVASAAGSPRRLDAIVLPTHVGDEEAVSMERLSSHEATVELLGLPRWFGWTLAEPQRLHFRTAADVAARVPVHRLRLPAAATRASSDLADVVRDAVR